MAEPPAPPPEPTGCRFTLTGLLVTLLIIGILTGLLIVSLNAAKETANRSACQSDFCQLYKAMHVYLSHFGRGHAYMPHTGQAFWLCLDQCLDPVHPPTYASQSPACGNNSLFICPSTWQLGRGMDYLGPRKQTPPSNPSALMNGLLPGLIIGCDKPGNHKNGGNVLLFDGVTRFIGDPDYASALNQTE